MFFILSKLLYFFIMPVTWVLVFLTWSLITKKHKIKNRLVTISLLVLLVLTNPFFLNTILKQVEYPMGNYNQLQKTDLGIVLTGFTQRIKSEDNRVFMSKGADRATHSVYLYNRKIIKKILVSGGSGALNSMGELSESQKVKNILIEMGVDKNDIYIEDKSHNTYENAKYSAEILNKSFKGIKPILITSATHMKRSISCFKKQGIEVTPFAGDYRSKRNGKIEPNDFIPNAGCLAIWSSIIHEWVGLLTYKILGYA